ncbi:hypothetical protein Gpo141_00000839 [Globisporangium polare]
MVRKASRLPPNTKSLEEVLLTRAVNGSSSPGDQETGGTSRQSDTQRSSASTAPSASASATRRLGTATKSIAAAQRARPATLAVPGGRRNASISTSSEPLNPTSAASGSASLECMAQLAGEVAALDKRVRSLATTAMSSTEGSRSRARGQSGEDNERTYYQQEIDNYLKQSVDEIYSSHSSKTKGKVASSASVNPTAGAHMTHAVREIRSTVRRLDRVFYEVASGDKQRQLAATKIAMLCRAFVTRRRFQKFQHALGAWRTRKCFLLMLYVEQFSAREEFINDQVLLMHEERTRSLLRRVMAELRDVVLMNLPLRMRRLEETERKFQLKQRTLIKSVFVSWKSMALGPRSRKKVAADSKKRHLEARQRLEHLERFELITTEMVHDEFLKENIRAIRGKHHVHVLRMFFKLLYTLEFLPVKQKMLRAIAHDRKKCILKIWGAWLPLFRAAQVDKAIARVSERRTLDRFDKHHNLRKIDAHYRRTSQLKHLRAWATYGQRIRRVRKLFEDNTKENLIRLLRKWHLRAQYQHALRENVVEEWKAYSRRVFQTPFRCWYVYAAKQKANRVAKETICLAYERRQRRHTKYTFFRLWKHQVLFGNVEGIHSQLHLLRSLEDQKRMCLGLEVNAQLYQESIAALQASITQLESKLDEKQSELAQLHEATQVTRFGIHTAEQNIARVQGMLEAVRHIHPGTVDRIEKMYKDNPLLSKDLKDVISLHVSKRKELMDKIDLDETELEVHKASTSGGHNSIVSEDDKMLLHRVKWVLSRMDLQQSVHADTREGSGGHRQTVVPMETMNQLCALFEFIRNGDTAVLAPENNPVIGNRSVSTSRGHSGSSAVSVRQADLFHKSESWHAFVQALTIKFVPERMLSVKERLVKRAAEMEDEVAEIKANPHIYNLYSGAAQVDLRTKGRPKTEPWQ